MTKGEERVHQAMLDALARDWKRVESRTFTMRWSERELLTPENQPKSWWPFPTYARHVFLTLIPGQSVVLRVCRVPWVECHDSRITQRRTLELLSDPLLAFDNC